ncbi:MAG: hypothetical protein M1546_13895, partial [Chloroflexi bacterium]|nr:hypothetical protein [Chloroflexota bacterium]
MNRQQLLDELERLPSGSRMRQMVELGHQASQRQDISATIDQMEQGNFYERHLALHSCYGSHDTARIMRALADPSRSIRKSALPLAALCCDDAQVQQVLAATLPKQRVVLLRWLLKHKRQAPIDAFLTTLVGHDERPDDPHLLGLLWFGSAGFVQPLLARLLPTATAVDWRRLARRHPALISHALVDLATLGERMDQRLRWQANAVLVTLSDLDPERALALVRELAQHIPLHQLDLSILARRRPNAVADLLLAADEQTSVNLASVAHHLSTDRLIALLVKRPGVVPLTDQWFRRLPPEQRVTLYRNFERGWRDGDNALPSWLIGRLPRELREGEGARHATLPAFAARPLQQIAYTALRERDEARHALDPFIRLLARPAAMVRVSALQRCQQLPISDPEQLLLPHLLASMASRIPDESVSAASAVFATYVGRQAPLTAQAVQRLLPNRRALQTALS